MRQETIAIHAGNATDQGNRAAIQPITLSTTFVRGNGEGGQFSYTRAANPNRASLENLLAKLEGGQDACAFGSGNAAGMSVFQALEPGSHVILPDDMYHGLRNGVLTVLRGVIEADFVDMTDLEQVRAAINGRTRLIWIETPSNPLLKISDIAAICRLAKEKNLMVGCDSTFGTPILQQPLALGADIVMHSTTKYLSGHSDVLGGALITKTDNAFWQRIRSFQELSGAVPAPFDCYMAVRGIKTLPYRMRGHVANASGLAEFLNAHPKVEHVFYPGLESHPGFGIARKQMQGGGGMLSFLVRGGAEEAIKLVNLVRVFTHATSLGGVESLIEQRASVEGPDTKTPANLVRVSVGLEHIDDLIADLSQALDQI
ncbi:MAG TPA: aminotransferase class I/II-fold pyridoxal phosphate-dependent enzyme [Sphingobacteriaceae bacterium]